MQEPSRMHDGGWPERCAVIPVGLMLLADTAAAAMTPRETDSCHDSGRSRWQWGNPLCFPWVGWQWLGSG